MADNVWEAPVVSAGERRLRRSGNAPSLRLSRALKASLALFVLLVLLGSAHSLWTIHRMHQNQQALNIAARIDQHFSRMVERAEHYESIAPRNYTDFNRDVELYYDSLLRDIDTMDWMVADLAQRDVAFNSDLWNDFRNELGQLESDVRQLARRTRALVEVLDTLNRARTLQEAIDRLPDRLTRQFDPDVLDALHDCIEDIRRIRELFDNPPMSNAAARA